MSLEKTLAKIKSNVGKRFSCVLNDVYVEGYIAQRSNGGCVLLFNIPSTAIKAGWRRTEYTSFPTSNGIYPELKYAWFISTVYDLAEIRHFEIKD